MEKLKLKHSAKNHEFVFSTIKKGVDKIHSIPNWESLELNQDLIEGIAKGIEDEIVEKGISPKKIDKKELLREIVHQAFDLDEEKMKVVDIMIEYMIAKYIIKKKTLVKKTGKVLKKLVSLFISK